MPVISIAAQFKDLGRERLWIELALGVIAPGFLAGMMMTYVVAHPLFPVFMALAIITALSVLWPLKKLHQRSYEAWQPNTIPKSLVVSAFGMIYITEVGIFSVVMLSLYQGLKPDNPITFGVAASLVIALIAVTAYNDKNKNRFDRTHRHMVKDGASNVSGRVKSTLDGKGHQYVLSHTSTGTRIDLSAHGVKIDMRPVSSNSTEVMMEITEGGNNTFAQGLMTDIHFR
ncbi:MAG: Sulfite exporter TauE/SafE [Methanomassiliicoccales archaeon PtaU1.Bin124]|nr:MAG: Sulfite exporter TauE/SafE [Methanomassiliicoccales archaeon PtaU1.Bin124]